MILRNFCKRAVIVLAAAAWSAVASAQATIAPNPGTAGQVLTLTAFLPGPGCPNGVASSTVTSVPGGIRIDYVVAAMPDVLCGTPPPYVFFTRPIGPFAPGSYTVDLEGGTIDEVYAPITASFTVVAAPGDAVSAPTLSIGGLLVLGLLVAGIASLKSFAHIARKPKP
ncbi:MAG: hypothetical protein ABIS07_07290 [Dokdonella sp.]